MDGARSPPFFVVAKEKQRRGPLAGRQLAGSSLFVFSFFPFLPSFQMGGGYLSARISLRDFHRCSC